jgi:hypothetical protein
VSRHLRGLLAVGIFSLLIAATSWAQEEMVANPYYKFWAGHKLGSEAVHLERTKLSGPEGKLAPGGVDEKRIVYKLVEVKDDRVVVEMVVTEQDFLGYVQAAPTRYIYPAKVKKSQLERILLEAGGKTGEATVMVGGKNMKCKTLTGTVKGTGGEQVDFQLWLAEEVPGTIVKHVRTARNKGEVIAETTSTLESFKKSN